MQHGTDASSVPWVFANQRTLYGVHALPAQTASSTAR
jgi:hypothetical protein